VALQIESTAWGRRRNFRLWPAPPVRFVRIIAAGRDFGRRVHALELIDKDVRELLRMVADIAIRGRLRVHEDRQNEFAGTGFQLFVLLVSSEIRLKQPVGPLECSRIRRGCLKPLFGAKSHRVCIAWKTCWISLSVLPAKVKLDHRRFQLVIVSRPHFFRRRIRETKSVTHRR
jgi:hypothetical protein